MPTYNRSVAVDENYKFPPEVIAALMDELAVVREDATIVTTSLAAGARWTGIANLAPNYRIVRVQVSTPARVRIYTSTTARDADLNRAVGTDPDNTTDHGVIMDIKLSTTLSRYLSPQVDGSSFDNSNVPITIDNLHTDTAVVTVILTYIGSD